MRIVTHHGSAHRDEFMACCLVLALPDNHDDPVIERREPTAADLDDPKVWVLDIGGRCEPALLNFDHHHLPSQTPPVCTFSLVLNHLGILMRAHGAWPWLELTILDDVAGPGAVAKTVGCAREAISRLGAPAEEYLLKLFAEKKTLARDDSLTTVMTAIGRRMRQDLDRFSERIEVLRRNGIVFTTLGGLRVFAYLAGPLPEHKLAVDPHCDALGGIAAIILPSERDEGLSLSRFRDHPDLDFRRLRGNPRVGFIHQSGFMAVTNGHPGQHELAALIDAARG